MLKVWHWLTLFQWVLPRLLSPFSVFVLILFLCVCEHCSPLCFSHGSVWHTVHFFNLCHHLCHQSAGVLQLLSKHAGYLKKGSFMVVFLPVNCARVFDCVWMCEFKLMLSCVSMHICISGFPPLGGLCPFIGLCGLLSLQAFGEFTGQLGVERWDADTDSPTVCNMKFYLQHVLVCALFMPCWLS